MRELEELLEEQGRLEAELGRWTDEREYLIDEQIRWAHDWSRNERRLEEVEKALAVIRVALRSGE